jgi:hypothetical protein
MPTPTIPKRTRSLGATVRWAASNGSGLSQIVLAASDAPAAAALSPRKSRREKSLFFMASPDAKVVGRLLFNGPNGYLV